MKGMRRTWLPGNQLHEWTDGEDIGEWGPGQMAAKAQKFVLLPNSYAEI